MIYTPEEYCDKFLIENKKVSPRTIKRRCKKGQLPSNHIATKTTGGAWIIEVADEVPQIKATKLNPTKPDIKTLNRKYFSFK